MKANWKLALMCLATLAMVACNNDKNDPDQGGGGEGIPQGYVPPISVDDKSLADWDALEHQELIARDELTADKPYHSALKKIQVYADSICIFYAITFDPAAITTPTETAGFHIYLNADNDPNTGGHWDLFGPENKGNEDILFEGSVWDNDGNQTSYLPPHISYWSGPTGDKEWQWTEFELVDAQVSASQFVEDGVVEGYLVRDLIPFKKWSNAFEIGFDVYDDNYVDVGLLPQGNAIDGGKQIGRKPKMKVTFDE